MNKQERRKLGATWYLQDRGIEPGPDPVAQMKEVKWRRKAAGHPDGPMSSAMMIIGGMIGLKGGGK